MPKNKTNILYLSRAQTCVFKLGGQNASSGWTGGHDIDIQTWTYGHYGSKKQIQKSYSMFKI